jgi:hypothetical protein
MNDYLFQTKKKNQRKLELLGLDGCLPSLAVKPVQGKHPIVPHFLALADELPRLHRVADHFLFLFPQEPSALAQNGLHGAPVENDGLIPGRFNTGKIAEVASPFRDLCLGIDLVVPTGTIKSKGVRKNKK